MYAYCPWVKVGERLQMLTPAVGCFAFSPSERYLAWVEGPDMRAVQVSELPSMRTVCTLAGSDFFALSWVGDEVLRVVRADRDRIVVTRHAVPDGGALGVAAVPRDSLTMQAQSSADGRVVLIRQAHFRQSQRTSRAFLVGARSDDAVTELSLLDPRMPSGPDARAQVDCALAPDGHRVGIVFHGAPRADPRVSFVTGGGDRVAEVPLERGDVQVIGWVSPTALLLHVGTALVRAELDGTSALVTPVPALTSLDDFDLHPERGQILHCVRSIESGRHRTLALRVGLTPSAPDFISLSEARAPDGATRDGGACWDRDGGIVTLTQSPRGVANLMRRPTAVSASVRLAHFKLIGEHPVDLALTASPRRDHFIAAWRCFDRGPADPVRRLALVSAP